MEFVPFDEGHYGAITRFMFVILLSFFLQSGNQNYPIKKTGVLLELMKCAFLSPGSALFLL